MTDETTTRKVTVEEYCSRAPDAELRDLARKPDDLLREAAARGETPTIEEWHLRRASAAAEELVNRHNRHMRTLRHAELAQAQARRDRSLNHPQRRQP